MPRLSDAERQRRSREKRARLEWEARERLATDDAAWAEHVAARRRVAAAVGARRGTGEPVRPTPQGVYRERGYWQGALSPEQRESRALARAELRADRIAMGVRPAPKPPDPERLRQLNRERVRRHRARQKALAGGVDPMHLPAELCPRQ